MDSVQFNRSRVQAADQRLLLQGAQLRPAPLYPKVLPPTLDRSNATLSITGELFTVVWDRGCCVSGVRRGYLSLGRAKRGTLASDLQIARGRGDHPQVVRVGRRSVWHLCGYAWHEQGFTYQAFGLYYAHPGSEARDLRSLIRNLAVLH